MANRKSPVVSHADRHYGTHSAQYQLPQTALCRTSNPLEASTRHNRQLYRFPISTVISCRGRRKEAVQ